MNTEVGRRKWRPHVRWSRRRKVPKDKCKCGEVKLASSKLCLECSTNQKKTNKDIKRVVDKGVDIKLIKYQCPDCSRINEDFVCRDMMMECYLCGFKWNGDYIW